MSHLTASFIRIATLLVFGVCVGAAPPPDDLLRGPAVPDRLARSLVTLDFNGNFVPLERRPEEAAVGLVVVDPQRRDAARVAAGRRIARLGLVLVDEIDLLRAATDALQGGEAERARDTYLALYAKFDPSFERSPLLAVYADVLNAEEMAEVTRLVDEYWTAWIDAEQRRAAGGDAAPDRADIERRLALQLAQRDLTEAYGFSIRPVRERLEAVYRVVEPTPEQRAAIRDIFIEHLRAGRLNPTPEQQAEAADRIYEILDEAQRRRIFARALWR